VRWFSVRCLQDLATLPTVSTANLTAITDTTATSGGEVTADGGATVTALGVCWNTTGNPTIADNLTTDGTGTGIFTSSLTGLTANTTYYVKAYATNAVGTAYGTEKTFTTGSCPASLTDYDGNSYNTVLIGTQCWMQENLKVTHYPNGTAIPNVTSNSAWGALGNNNTDDAYCYYDNSTANVNTYGALYTWAAAMGDNAVSSSTNPSGVQGACPTGWHLPSDNEWKQLEMQLGMSQSEADQTGWRGTDQGSQLAGNSSLWDNGNLEYNANFGTSGFTALPGGSRTSSNGLFHHLGYYGTWWSSTQHFYATAWGRGLNYDLLEVNRYDYDKSFGVSVRCLQD